MKEEEEEREKEREGKKVQRGMRTEEGRGREKLWSLLSPLADAPFPRPSRCCLQARTLSKPLRVSFSLSLCYTAEQGGEALNPLTPPCRHPRGEISAPHNGGGGKRDLLRQRRGPKAESSVSTIHSKPFHFLLDADLGKLGASGERGKEKRHGQRFLPSPSFFLFFPSPVSQLSTATLTPLPSSFSPFNFSSLPPRSLSLNRRPGAKREEEEDELHPQPVPTSPPPLLQPPSQKEHFETKNLQRRRPKSHEEEKQIEHRGPFPFLSSTVFLGSSSPAQSKGLTVVGRNFTK